MSSHFRVGYFGKAVGNTWRRFVTGKYNDVMQPAKRESALRAQGGGRRGRGPPGGPRGPPGGPEACQNPASGLPEPCQWPGDQKLVPGDQSRSPASSWPVRRRASRAMDVNPGSETSPGRWERALFKFVIDFRHFPTKNCRFWGHFWVKNDHF